MNITEEEFKKLNEDASKYRALKILAHIISNSSVKEPSDLLYFSRLIKALEKDCEDGGTVYAADSKPAL